MHNISATMATSSSDNGEMGELGNCRENAVSISCTSKEHAVTDSGNNISNSHCNSCRRKLILNTCMNCVDQIIIKNVLRRYHI